MSEARRLALIICIALTVIVLTVAYGRWTDGQRDQDTWILEHTVDP